MTLKELVLKSMEIIGLDVNVDFENPSVPLKKVIDSAKMIYSELVLEYVPLKTREKSEIKEGRIYYSDLSRPVREIISITKGGRKISFEHYPTCVKCFESEGEVEVQYLFHVTDLDVDEELILPPQFTIYFLSTGVVSEYYYRIGMVDEALFYKTRYDHSLENLSRKLKSVRLPERRLLV